MCKKSTNEVKHRYVYLWLRSHIKSCLRLLGLMICVPQWWRYPDDDLYSVARHLFRGVVVLERQSITKPCTPIEFMLGSRLKSFRILIVHISGIGKLELCLWSDKHLQNPSWMAIENDFFLERRKTFTVPLASSSLLFAQRLYCLLCLKWRLVE